MAPPPENGGYPRNLPQAGKEIKMDHDQLKTIANRLQEDLDRLRDARWKEALEDYGNPGQPAIGDYSAGHGLHNTTKTAQTAIGSTYDQFLTAYQNVITALRDSEKNTRNADDQSRAGVNSVGGSRFAS
nr:hypothetical protein GCM10010200_050520 [Actinomadura rugatobispora]